MQETWVRSLGWEDPLEKETATHSSILAWRIPWTEEPGGLQSTGLQRVGRDWATTSLSSLIPMMLIFNLAISCLIMSNLPWFMDLTFQGPTQYCSLQHWILLSPPDTSTTGCRSCFVPTASFFLELLVIALCSSPVVYWTLSDLGGSSPLGVSYLFAFSCCSWGSSGKNTGVVCHSLLQWTTFCQNSSLWPICLGWTCTAWLRAPLSYEAPSPVKGYDPWMGSISWVLSTQLLSK